MCSRISRTMRCAHREHLRHLGPAQVEVAVAAGAGPRPPRCGPRSGTAASRTRSAPRASAAATSTSPVASSGFRMPSGRARTVPVTRTTSSPPQLLRRRVRLGGVLGMEHDLHDALAVAQVDEGHAAVIAAVRHPAAQGRPRRRRRSARSSPHAWRPHRGPHGRASSLIAGLQSSSRVSQRATSPARHRLLHAVARGGAA